jgi:hypothetical protein
MDSSHVPVKKETKSKLMALFIAAMFIGTALIVAVSAFYGS